MLTRLYMPCPLDAHKFVYGNECFAFHICKANGVIFVQAFPGASFVLYGWDRLQKPAKIRPFLGCYHQELHIYTVFTDMYYRLTFQVLFKLVFICLTHPSLACIIILSLYPS